MSGTDERVKEAVRILWLVKDYEKGAAAKELLEQAAKEGDPDAYYFLARCYAGTGFIDPNFGFPEDDNKAYGNLDLSIEKGSALGMFAGMRFGGFKPRCGSFVHAPYQSLKEVWDEVCKKADSGDLFIKYLVANAYYYGDVARFMGVDFSHVSRQYLDNQFKEWAMTAIPMYEELISRDLLFLVIGNYLDIITSGDYGVPKNMQRAMELKRMAADKGDSYYMVRYGRDLEESDPDQAAAYYQRGIDNGNASGYYYLGHLYTFRGKKPRDLRTAKEFFEKGLEAKSEEIGCNNCLGEIYFYGGDGIAINYEKAFYHLLAANNEDNHWGAGMLGTCYLKGWGTTTDYLKARKEFCHRKEDELSAVGLGEIYAYGLGVVADIKAAMEFWNKFPDNPRVIENKKRFKKTLFGWKQIQ